MDEPGTTVSRMPTVKIAYQAFGRNACRASMQSNSIPSGNVQEEGLFRLPVSSGARGQIIGRLGKRIKSGARRVQGSGFRVQGSGFRSEKHRTNWPYGSHDFRPFGSEPRTVNPLFAPLVHRSTTSYALRDLLRAQV